MEESKNKEKPRRKRDKRRMEYGVRHGVDYKLG